MKYTLAVAALLGLTTATTSEYAIQEAVPIGVALSQLQADSSSSDSSDSEEDDMNVQLEDFQPGQAGRLGNAAYDRKIPDRFSADSDDIFMRSVYNNYAIEKEDKDTHAPTGVFYLDEANAQALAREVLSTHKGLTG